MEMSMEITQIKCPFCKRKFFRNLSASLLPRSKIHVCDKCIEKGLEEQQYKEPEPEEELGDKFYNPSQRKTPSEEIEELKGLIRDEYKSYKGREPTELEMTMELKKWIWLCDKNDKKD
jgi:hypothetical protein